MYTPQIKDYIKWMIIPALLGVVTCGIGSIILMIVWACDNNDMPRANYFRAQFIIIGVAFVITMGIALLFGASLSALLR